MSVALLVAGVILVALVAYTVSGGADFGGGVWDLLASGPRKDRQRELISHAIAPIWEANHVWLIVVIVLLFVCFPTAFAAISTALHIPLLLMLMGIVLRGSAFTFRAYGKPTDREEQRWGTIFAISSVFTPVMLGIVLGGVSTGDLQADPQTGRITTDFVAAWWSPYPVALGIFVLVLFSFLAAVYLAVEAQNAGDDDLADDFRRRALASGLALGVAALVTFLVAGSGAPRVHEGLAGRWWSLPFQLLTGLVSLAALGAAYARRFGWARVLAMGQAALIVTGFGVSQYPYLVVPDLTIDGTAAPDNVLTTTLWVLGAGAVFLVPAFIWLYSVFKATPNAPDES